MPLIGTNLKKNNLIIKTIPILPLPPNEQISSSQLNDLPVVKHLLSMFRIGNNSIRTRRNKTPWTESYNGKTTETQSITHISDHNNKFEIPVTKPLELR